MFTWLLFAVRGLVGGCLVGYASYAVLSVWAARKWRIDRPTASPEWTPAVTILKPVCGVDADGWENFRSFCRVDYPFGQMQILFCALDSDDQLKNKIVELRQRGVKPVSINTWLRCVKAYYLWQGKPWLLERLKEESNLGQASIASVPKVML